MPRGTPVEAKGNVVVALSCYGRSLVVELVQVITSPQRRATLFGEHLYANAGFLMANSAITAALGFVFWIVVARLYSTEDVGYGSALISLASLLGFIGSLGLGLGLIRFLPLAGQYASALINFVFTVSLAVSLAVTVVFIVGIPLWSPAYAFLRENVAFSLAFVGFVGFYVLSGGVHASLLAFRRAEFTTVTNIIFSILKLLLPIVLVGFFKTFGVLASWGVAVAVAATVGGFFLIRLHPEYRPWPVFKSPVGWEVVRFSLTNYVAEGMWGLPGWLLPTIIVNLLGPKPTAYFFIAWSMAGLLLAIPNAIATSVFVEGSHREELLGRDLGRGIKMTIVLVVPAVAFILLFGDRLLLLFGQDYSAGGVQMLWALVPAVLPVSVNILAVGMWRVQRRLREIVLLDSVIAGAVLALSCVLLPSLGILGVGLAWTAVHAGVALAIAPRVHRVLTTPAISG